MKTIKNIFSFTAVIGLLMTGVHPSGGVSTEDSSLTDEPYPLWAGLIGQLNPGSNIMIVQQGSSIQDALDVAVPGDVIYIEPGIYREALEIGQSDIQVIGLPGKEGEAVILENPGSHKKAIERKGGVQNTRFFNIQFAGFSGPGVIIHPLDPGQPDQGADTLNMTREELGNGIAHYTFEVDLGSEEFDKIRIHRVVKERNPYEPVKTRGDVFMVHAAIQDFDDIYLRVGAEEINEKTSSPVYLASHKIDVWGIDLAWTLVPLETTDFSFMKGWGMERDVDHTLAAMTIARLIRGLTGQGYDRMNLLGYCCTANLVYAAAGEETQMPRVQCNLKGIIPVEGYMMHEPVPDNAQWKKNVCAGAEAIKAMLDAGMYNYPDGMGLLYMAQLALEKPEEVSAIPPFDEMGLTNYQAMLVAGFSPAENPDTPYWHYFGGTMEDGFLYADQDRFIRMGMNLNPHMPLEHLYDSYACGCDSPEHETGIDDHLGDIMLPILYLGAEGGVGTYGIYSTGLTSSRDITHHIVSMDVDRAIDYGHADIWMGYEADELMWKYLQKWLADH